MKNAYKIVVLGSPGVGKTTLIEVAVYGNQHRLLSPIYDPTIEDTYCALVEFDKNQKEKILIYDYGGLGNGPPLNPEVIKNYLTFCDAFLLVFSMDDRDSFVMVAQLKKLIDKLKDKKDIPILVAANKIDKIQEYVLAPQEIRKWSVVEKVKLLECSGHDRSSVSECFTWAARQLYVSKSTFSRKSKTGGLQLEL